MTVTIIIRGRNGRMLFFDEADEKVFVWACSLLPSHLKNDQRHYERCCIVRHLIVERDHATLEVELWESSAEYIADFLCKVYDSYFRRKYKRDGKISEYEIKRD